ncbi:MAG: selenium cofactor biosynthesis protein YqeC [Chloroflexota bacterium]
MNLSHALRISHPSCIAFVGAGGKTTAMFQLARQFASPVLVTASSHLGAWQIPLADRHILAEAPAELGALEQGLEGVTLVTGRVEGERTRPVSAEVLARLHETCQARGLPLLVEADGSRRLPLKAPAEHEPPIPAFAEIVIVTAGLSGLGKALREEHIFRPEIFARLGGLGLEEPVTPEALVRVLCHPEGGLKNIPSKARRIALLNQADTPELQAQAARMAASLLEAYDAVVVASLGNAPDGSIHAVHEPIAGIILAAGEGRRFGAPKQLLDWKGQPFVRQVAQSALRAGLRPVLVITGFRAADVESALRGLPVTIVRNDAWQEGQASSVRAAVGRLLYPPPNSSNLGEGRVGVGGGIFLLADQPQVTVEVIRALVERHTQSLPPVLAPLVLEEKRANPVLFDRACFPDLLNLEGDTGGRALFSKYPVAYLPWHDQSLLLDVDTPADYRRLQESLG